MPRFSVVVPTRDRPDLLTFCLEALAAQTLEDFEVIVCDNWLDRPARNVFDRWAGPGWYYIEPPKPLLMHENWEFAAEHARGDFIAIVIDKTILQPTALEVADKTLAAEPTADIVTWWNDAYVPSDELNDAGLGVLLATTSTTQPSFYDAAAELREMFSFRVRRGVDPIHYCRGKICFGAYSQGLIARIRKTTGRLFHPLSPDYTSRISALALAHGAIDVGRPLLLSYWSERSNGRRATENPSYTRSFVESVDPSVLAHLPIPGLYASSHNVVAYDYAMSYDRLPRGTVPNLDVRNLLHRAREDMAVAHWSSIQEHDEQYAILMAHEARLGVVPPSPSERSEAEAVLTPRRLAAKMLACVPPANTFVKWATRRPPSMTASAPQFASPVAAAFAADRKYTTSAAKC